MHVYTYIEETIFTVNIFTGTQAFAIRLLTKRIKESLYFANKSAEIFF